ncbi:predicted protein [Arabidopsis lyrata subsp. lyrata]|uniref:Predicted protein n=1 Tax=Arabidopsis lyrata subsp. lyrata TaxID=81972 RepID=D7LIT6_ARALL|nr:predicted protein [Arabidopsis lyrata subsp. lyrata]
MGTSLEFGSHTMESPKESSQPWTQILQSPRFVDKPHHPKLLIPPIVAVLADFESPMLR